jgi:hypothetical protein
MHPTDPTPTEIKSAIAPSDDPFGVTGRRVVPFHY